MSFYTQEQAEQLAAKCREIAKERPYTTYDDASDGCHYHKGQCSDGTVGCIIGQAAKALGLLVFTGSSDIRDLCGSSTSEAVCFLELLQGFQDTGDNWGQATIKAGRELGEA